jgi:MurNAc alpha-1-phosphate uridylyltransferase
MDGSAYPASHAGDDYHQAAGGGMSIDRAIILAAGRGERMRPLTDRMPKPLVQVAGRTLLDHALDQVERHGINQVVVNISYKAEMITHHLASRSHPTIQFSHEENPLETGGGIAKALPLLGDKPFFSLNSDTICIDRPQMATALERLEQAWNPQELDVLMLLQPVKAATGYHGRGDFAVERGKLRRRHTDEQAPYVFTGIQIVHPRLFTICPEGPFSMNVLYDRLRDTHGYFKNLGYVIHEGDWLHVGDPQGLELAESYYANGHLGTCQAQQTAP